MSEMISAKRFPGPAAYSTEADSRAEAVLATLLESVDCGILLFGTGGELWP
jgi:hypothetical protein